MIVLILLIYWCYNKRLGEGMLLSLYLAAALNGIIKDLVRRPRPFMNEGYEVRYVESEKIIDTVSLKDSYSFPSGHSMNTAALAVSAAIGEKGGKRGRLCLLICFICIPLIMISRVYLGVHYPTDTLAGAFLGIICAFLVMKLFNKFYEKRYFLFCAAFALSLISLAFEPTGDTIKTLGLGAGALLGFIIESRFIKFKVDGTVLRKAIRLIVGAALILAMKSGLKALFPDEALFWALRYFIIGIFGTAVYPYAFTKLKL